MTLIFESLVRSGFDVAIQNHAGAIMSVDFPEIADEICKILLQTRIPARELIGSGGGEAQSTQRLRKKLYKSDWPKHNFDFKMTVDWTCRGFVPPQVLV